MHVPPVEDVAGLRLTVQAGLIRKGLVVRTSREGHNPLARPMWTATFPGQSTPPTWRPG